MPLFSVAVGTAGSEYVFDPDRFDPIEIQERQFAVDQLRPERPRGEYRRHHLAGESSIMEMIEAWALTAQEEGAADEDADPERIHWGITHMLSRNLAVERSWGMHAVRGGGDARRFAGSGRPSSC